MLLGAAVFFDSRGAICAVEMHNVVFPGSAEFAPLWYNRLGRRDSLRVLLVCVSQGLYQSLRIAVGKILHRDGRHATLSQRPRRRPFTVVFKTKTRSLQASSHTHTGYLSHLPGLGWSTR